MRLEAGIAIYLNPVKPVVHIHYLSVGISLVVRSIGERVRVESIIPWGRAYIVASM